ncbi:hypothetical protein BP5796_12896 [Coleophoma crateriformis]|uniref:Amidohydrolase-related domain-containing protein n=1 Tax=Coleophoma crateriformis TaxID=565419 RepID=A0A3D8Q4T0_9HELO|nr:hypothetical protein BP5796_12896 [Coleophoma crateriformis]
MRTPTHLPTSGDPKGRPRPADITINNHKPKDPKQILFKNVRILDSTGREPYLGDVLIEDEWITQVGKVDEQRLDDNTKTIDGQGKKTLMSGLTDSHTHLSWNNSPTIEGLTSLPLEEHVLHTANFARIYLDCGYTMCFGAAAAQARLDVVVRDAVKAGLIPGPRILANGQEISTTGGAIVPNITKFADGPDAMRRVVREFCALGVDNLKLSMSGDEIHETMRAEETYFTQEETNAAVDEAHARGKRICSHARSNEAVKQSCIAGVDVIYHASFADDEAIDMLEKVKDRCFVSPAINFPWASAAGEAIPYGLTPEMAIKKGLKREVDAAVIAMQKMHTKGIRILPGGDYGFAWAPHGTYARDLVHFVNMFGFTPMESIIAATALGGELMGHPDVLGKVLPGYYADVILVNGDPLEDLSLFQRTENLHAIVINGHIHKNCEEEADIPRGADIVRVSKQVLLGKKKMSVWPAEEHEVEVESKLVNAAANSLRVGDGHMALDSAA